MGVRYILGATFLGAMRFITVTAGLDPGGVVSDRDEFRDFVLARRRAWLHSAWLLTGDWHAAEDLVQTALLRTFPHWRRIEASAPDAYVRRVMMNLYASWRRRRWRWEVSTEDLSEQAMVADDYLAAERRSLVIAALRELPPRQRATIVLRYFDELSEAETAEAMNCSLGTVKSQTSRALATLRRSGVLVHSKEKDEVTHVDIR